MTNLWIDLETYSDVDLRRSNVYRYAESDEFLILMCAWATEDDVMLGRVNVAIGEEEIKKIPGLFDSSVTKVAHNAQFERICLSKLAGLPTGEYLPPEDYEDTQVLAAEWGYPQRLEALAVALGAEEKDSAGTRLINMFSKPNRKGTRTLPEEKPEDWKAFVEYCRQDVATLVDIHERLLARHGGWPTDTERDMYLLDQEINDRGILVDVPMAEAAIAASEENQDEQKAEIQRITDGAVENPGSPKQLSEWLDTQGVEMANMRAETVEKMLQTDIPAEARQVLELRQELALVASKKYLAATDRVNSDNRLRGSFQFFGAHTGRWAGRGVQLQNLPAATMESVDHTNAAILDLMMGAGATAHELKALVRALFLGPFAVVDYSAIEARVIAWLAGEQWALDAFAAGRDIYVETAGRMFNVDEGEALRRRKQGKVAVLALGYNGGINSLKAMGAEGNDVELQRLVHQWRAANEEIVSLWHRLDDAFRHGGDVGAHLSVEKVGHSRYLRLPSGRSIAYHQVGQRWVTKWDKRVREMSFADPKKPGLRVPTYGGKLAENVTQAVARDILVSGLLNLARAGYEIVGHVHDEILVQSTHLPEDVEMVSRLMTKNPSWADGLPLAAEGFLTQRYRKD